MLSVFLREWAYPVTAGTFAGVFLVSWALERHAFVGRRRAAASKAAALARSRGATGLAV